MSQASLKNILQQLPTLSEDELRRIEQAVKDRLVPNAKLSKRDAVYAALRASGLVPEIKQPKSPRKPAALVNVKGKPVSQTIIEERR